MLCEQPAAGGAGGQRPLTTILTTKPADNHGRRRTKQRNKTRAHGRFRRQRTVADDTAANFNTARLGPCGFDSRRQHPENPCHLAEEVGSNSPGSSRVAQDDGESLEDPEIVE